MKFFFIPDKTVITISILCTIGIYFSNHSIFRHDNFIGCFSADKIKMSARK